MMLAMDSLAFILTWVPFTALLFNPYTLPTKYCKIVHTIIFILLVTNCFSTPIMYFIFNKDFKVSHHLLTNTPFNN